MPLHPATRRTDTGKKTASRKDFHSNLTCATIGKVKMMAILKYMERGRVQFPCRAIINTEVMERRGKICRVLLIFSLAAILLSSAKAESEQNIQSRAKELALKALQGAEES